MEKKQNKFISVVYKLYTIDESGQHLFEEVADDQPFEFITGLGNVLNGFEQVLEQLGTGDEFDIVLDPDQAHGDYNDDNVIEMEREQFCIDGIFDYQRIRIGAVIPLRNEVGEQFMGRVIDIRPDAVVIDLNHPLAGKKLAFRGHIVGTRDATEEEVMDNIKQLVGDGGDGCSCGNDCVGNNCGCGGKCDGDKRHTKI